MNGDILFSLLREYEEAQRKYAFFCKKNAWLLSCPHSVDVEKLEQAKKDVIYWRDMERLKRNVLVESFKKI